MKQTIVILVLSCFGCKAESHVSRKEVKAAKAKYMYDKSLSGWDCPLYEKMDTIPVNYYYECMKDFATKTQLDSLTWRGLQAIRHDQKFWVKKK